MNQAREINPRYPMKKLLSLIGAFSGLALVCYWGYFFILPSVTVINDYGQDIESFVVKLPSSRLDFGKLSPLQESTIYYSLDQGNGVYAITATAPEAHVTTTECGYVTANERHKRVVVVINQRHEIVCHDE